MEHVDWTEARNAYVTGSESYAALAERMGLRRSEVQRRARAEGWVKLRWGYRRGTPPRTVEEPSPDARETADGGRDARVFKKIREASDLIDVVMIRLLREMDGELLMEVCRKGAAGRELEYISKTLLNNDELKRRLYGLLPPKEAERLRFDRERAEWDRQRAKDGREEAWDVVVRFEGAASAQQGEAWSE